MANARKKPQKTLQAAAKGSSSSKADEDFVRNWTRELELAHKREKSWRKLSRELVEIYEGRGAQVVPFNILYSNTETLSPAVYNATPRPVVKPRYSPKSPIPKLAAAVSEAYLDFFVDSSEPEYQTFDELMQHSVLSGLVPGRGLVRFCYEADTEKDEAGAPKAISSECIYGEAVDYDRFLHGYAKRWKDIPWIAFEHFLSKDEVEAMFGVGALVVPFTERDRSESSEMISKVDDSEGAELSHWYEIWDKTKKEMFFLCEGYTRKVWKQTPDPYLLEGFFPIPPPLTFVKKLSSLLPQALYQLYRNQAEELNRITRRIDRVTESIKATGYYNSQIEGLKGVIEMEDGKMMPIENLQALGDGASLSNAIWFWPAKELVIVLQTLYGQREACKQVIYEIMGIADILRGASVASETATAQSLKSKWGSIRIKRFQKEVARYVRDCLRLASELAFKKLSNRTLAAATCTPLPSEEEKAQAKQQAATMMAQAQMAASAPPQPLQPGQPPMPPAAPPQLPPELQMILAAPSYDSIFGLLRSDLLTDYAIDIETDSTVDAEATDDREGLTEFLAAMGQFFLAIGPLVQEGVFPFAAAKQMLLTISRKFRLGRELDDELEAMQDPKASGAGGQDKAAAAAQAQLQQDQAKFAQDKAAFQAQTVQQKGQLQLQALQNDMRSMLDKAQAQVQSERDKAKIQALISKLDLMIQTHSQEMDLAQQAHMANVQGAIQSAEIARKGAETVTTAKSQAAAALARARAGNGG